MFELQQQLSEVRKAISVASEVGMLVASNTNAATTKRHRKSANSREREETHSVSPGADNLTRGSVTSERYSRSTSHHLDTNY